MRHKNSFAAIVSGVAIALAGLLAACAATPTPAPTIKALDSGFGKRSENRDVYFFTYYNPATDAFWKQIFNGAKDGAQLSNFKFHHETADGNSVKMIANINQAIKAKAAAIVMAFNEGQAWVDVACKAHAAGIPVIGFNVPVPKAAQDCVSGYVGQDFYAVGRVVANKLLASGYVSKGDKVLITAEEPNQPYALARGAGVYDVLKAAGINVTPHDQWLRTTGDDATAFTALSAWLTKHPDVKAVVPIGGTPNRNLPAALLAAHNKTAKVFGFDTAPAILQGIKDGVIIATADQQGYVQGFQSMIQTALLIDFGFSPSDINSGGNGLITKENVEQIEAPDLEGIRY